MTTGYCSKGTIGKAGGRFLLTVCAVMVLIPAAASAGDLPPFVGEMKTHVTKYEDTLVEIARANDIGFNELRSANPYVDPWMPGADVKLVLPTRHLLPDAVRRGIVINLPEMRLYLYGPDGGTVESHPIGVGREGLSTPVGTTKVVRKVVGPIWRPTDRMRKEHPELPVEVGPGPENPMGTHAMYLGWDQYAIHGTDKPYAIGRRASSGCIRMYPEDIIKVFPKTAVGTSVTVVNQPVKAAWIDGRLYVEAHPPLDQAMMIEEQGGRPFYDMTDEDMKQILRIAGDREDLLDWAKIRAVIRNRQGYPVAVAEDPGIVADAPAAVEPEPAESAGPPVRKAAYGPEQEKHAEKAPVAPADEEVAPSPAAYGPYLPVRHPDIYNVNG